MAKANGGNDKQKVLILSALFVVLVGVGAFTLMGGGSTAPAPQAKAEGETDAEAAATAAETTAQATDQKDGAVSELFPQRDPFNPTSDGTVTSANNTPAPVNPTPPPPPAIQEPVRVSSNMQPPTGLPPMDPMSGSVQPLPGVNGSSSQITGNVAPNQESRPSYRLSGVISGTRPMAVIEGPDGKQKIVKVGDRIGGERVKSIRNGRVILQGQGDREASTTLTLEEKTNAESGS